MIYSHLYQSRNSSSFSSVHNQNYVINSLIKSRNLFNVQTFNYDLMAVSSLDLDPTGNFLLVGLSNGSIDLHGIQDPTYGTLDPIERVQLSPFNLHRLQWNPSDEQFFSILDNHTLHLVDPVEMRTIEKFNFNLKTTWSEWNFNDRKIIAVCGTESQTRLVDISTGSSIQTIILSAKSGLSSHRATRCLWSRHDSNCLIVGDNEGYLHVYDTRHSSRPILFVGEELGQISGMAFTSDDCSIITSQGTENRLVQWQYDRGVLKADPNKFKKRKISKEVEENSNVDMTAASSSSSSSRKSATISDNSKKNKYACKKVASLRKHTRRIIPLPVDAYIRCQFYVSDRHVFCPVPSNETKSKEFYIYDIDSGYRIRTIKSDDVLSQGVYSVVGLLPDSMSLYVGGRGRLKVWTLDEDYQQKMEEKKKKYHQTRWDSDDELEMQS